MFKVYNSMIHHLYIAFCTHYPLLLSLYILSPLLFTTPSLSFPHKISQTEKVKSHMNSLYVRYTTESSKLTNCKNKQKCIDTDNMMVTYIPYFIFNF